MWPVEVGITTGCTVSSPIFTTAVDLVVRATKWVIGEEGLKGRRRLLCTDCETARLRFYDHSTVYLKIVKQTMIN